MNITESFRKKIVETALNLGVFTFNPKEPYTWASGIKSPVYNNNRLPLSFRTERDIYLEALFHTIRNIEDDFDCIVGVPTGGIPWATMVAYTMSKDLVILNEENQAFRWTASNLRPVNPKCQIVGMVNGSLVDATYIAYVKDLPLSYVRKGQKNHGLMNIVEGKLIQGLPIITVSSLLPGEVSYLDSNILQGYKTLHHQDVYKAFKPYNLKGKRVLVMEDLVSKATSLTTKVVEPIRARGGIVERIACMFSYGLFPAVDEKMKEAGCTLHPVYTFEHLIAGLEESQTLSESDLVQIKEWAKDPDKWSSDWITANEPDTNEC